MSNGLLGNLGGMMDRLEGMAGQAAATMKQIGDMGSQLGTIQQVVSMIRHGGNPMQLIASFANQNPKAKQMLGNLQGKSDAELRQYAENMAKSYGTDLNTVFNRLGLQMPQ